jgi:hypothetical protein
VAEEHGGPQGLRPAGEQQGGTPPTEPQLGGPAKPAEVTPEIQTLINSIIAKERRGWETKSDERLTVLQKQLDAAHESISGFNRFVQDLTAPQEPGSPIQDYEKAIQPPTDLKDDHLRKLWTDFARQRWEDTQKVGLLTESLDSLQKDLKVERDRHVEEAKQRAEIEQRSRETTKRALLATIALENDAVDAEAVRRHFWEDLVWDDQTQQYMLKTDDSLQEPRKGAKSVFPAYLRRALGPANGGSGAEGHKEVPAEDRLKELQTATEHWFKQAQADPQNRRAQIEYQTARRKLRDLQAQPHKTA